MAGGLASSVGQSVGRLVTPGAVHYPSAPAACGYGSWPDSEVYYLATLSVLDSAGLCPAASRSAGVSSGHIRVDVVRPSNGLLCPDCG